EAGDHVALGEPAHLAGVALDDGLPKTHLPVAADDGAPALADHEDSRGVPAGKAGILGHAKLRGEGSDLCGATQRRKGSGFRKGWRGRARGSMNRRLRPKERSPMSTDGAPLFRRDDHAGVATITLTSAANRNALSLLMLNTLIVAFDEMAGQDAVRAIVVAGDGPAFSSGHDLREIQAHSNDADRGA